MVIIAIIIEPINEFWDSTKDIGDILDINRMINLGVYLVWIYIIQRLACKNILLRDLI